MREENWKDIKGFKDYQISDLGRVKSFKIDSENGKILSQNKNDEGYMLVVLHNEGIHYTKKVHKLVAEAFLPNPENKPEVNHKNPVSDIECDNSVENLEWVTSQENANYKYINGSYVKKGKAGRLIASEVLDILELSKTLNQVEIAKKYNVSKSTINDIITGKKWSKITGIQYVPTKKNTYLSEKDVLEIVRLYNEEDKTYKEISELFNISDASVGNIITGRTWSKITGIQYDKGDK